MIEYIFVYGTLKPGLRFHNLCQDVGLVSAQEGYLENYDLYHLSPENYPAVVAGSGTVYGYIFSFEDINEALEVLDDLEGINTKPAHYFRHKVTVKPQNIEAWAYIFNINNPERKTRLELVKSGNWEPEEP